MVGVRFIILSWPGRPDIVGKEATLMNFGNFIKIRKIMLFLWDVGNFAGGVMSDKVKEYRRKGNRLICSMESGDIILVKI